MRKIKEKADELNENQRGNKMIITKGNTTKEMIINELSRSWPLSLKKIYYECKKSGKSITYQAVHKALKELIKDGVVKKQQKDYSLNVEWITDVKNYTEGIYLNYKENRPPPKVSGQNQVEFETLWDMYVYMLDILEAGILDPAKKRVGCTFFYHFWTWMPLTFSKKEYDQLLNIKKQNTCYMIGNKDTPMDKYVADFYKKMGWLSVVDKNVAEETCDTIVHGDTVIKIHFAPNIRKALERTLAKVKDPQSVNVNLLYHNVFHLKTSIIVTVNTNPALAKQIYNEAEKLVPKNLRLKYNPYNEK